MNAAEELIRKYLRLGMSPTPLVPKGKRSVVKWSTFKLTEANMKSYIGCNWAIKASFLDQ